VLVVGILYLNQFRDRADRGARRKPADVQGEIIAPPSPPRPRSTPTSITIDPEKLLELQAGTPFTPLSLDEPRIPDQSGARRAGAAQPDLADAHAGPHLRSADAC
jgi:hypothetical protein